MPIGNNENIKPVAYKLLQLAGEAKQVGRKLLKVTQTIEFLESEGVTITPQQLNDALSEIDVANIQTLFNEAKASYLDVNIIPFDEGV